MIAGKLQPGLELRIKEVGISQEQAHALAFKKGIVFHWEIQKRHRLVGAQVQEAHSNPIRSLGNLGGRNPPPTTVKERVGVASDHLENEDANAEKNQFPAEARKSVTNREWLDLDALAQSKSHRETRRTESNQRVF